ncbi:MAG: FAD-dependent oxidoreductase, partial [Patescibacteria group bacterium]|nr:FAD-dependent oxidoreductase [Patescibacteria group bacterium]
MKCAAFIAMVMLGAPSHAADPVPLEVRQFTLPAEGLPTVEQSERDLPVVGQADVVVVGGGVAGVAAALKAVEAGLSVVLVEQRNDFGHELTATYRRCDGIDPRQLRSQLQQKIAKAEGDEKSDLTVLLYTGANAVVREGKRVRGVVITNHSGRQVILAKVVVDATPEGRIATAAGARFDRNLTGRKTVRRFVSVRRPSSLPIGEQPVPESLGLQGNRVLVHDRTLELVLETEIGKDLDRDLSALQATTLEKTFAVASHLAREGKELAAIVPAAEIWIDEMPLVARRADWTETERSSLKLVTTDAVLPAGVEGLVVAGRLAASGPA